MPSEEEIQKVLLRIHKNSVNQELNLSLIHIFADLGFSFPESSANFIFATHKTAAAEDIFKALREKDIYVRYFNLPRINNYLRITIGTDWEMEKLIEALKEILYDREG